MNVSSVTAQLLELFQTLAQSLAQSDLAKARNCYHLPCTLSTPDHVMLLTTEAEFSDAYQAIFTQLKDQQFSAFKMLNSTYQKLTQTVFLVNIDWQFFSDDEQLITEFAAIYHVSVIDQQVKIINAVSQDISQSLALSQSLIFTA
ncbi:hypothetical protein [Thalassotalea agariperforans]